MENVKQLNMLIALGDSAPLYEFLYSLTIDQMIEVLHGAGFGCGNMVMLKQTILWSISEELGARKLIKKQLEPKPVPADIYNNFATRINQAFIAALALQDKRKTAAVGKKMLGNLDKLKAAKKIPGEKYVHEQFLVAIELRICRWLCDYQERGVFTESPEVPVLFDVLSANRVHNARQPATVVNTGERSGTGGRR